MILAEGGGSVPSVESGAQLKSANNRDQVTMEIMRDGAMLVP